MMIALDTLNLVEASLHSYSMATAAGSTLPEKNRGTLPLSKPQIRWLNLDRPLVKSAPASFLTICESTMYFQNFVYTVDSIFCNQDIKFSLKP
jgi:hypothetical protein